jgi:hypothetical protein
MGLPYGALVHHLAAMVSGCIDLHISQSANVKENLTQISL